MTKEIVSLKSKKRNLFDYSHVIILMISTLIILNMGQYL